jgi:hypothetical protein
MSNVWRVAFQMMENSTSYILPRLVGIWSILAFANEAWICGNISPEKAAARRRCSSSRGHHAPGLRTRAGAFRMIPDEQFFRDMSAHERVTIDAIQTGCRQVG